MKYLSPICLLFLWPTCFACAQTNSEPSTNFQVILQAGIPVGILDDMNGVAFSSHFRALSSSIFSPEGLLFFDYASGNSFLSGRKSSLTQMGIAVGGRLNFLRKNRVWQPSIYLFPGLASVSRTHADGRQNSSIEAIVSIGITNTFYRKHSLNIGLQGEFFTLKYGFALN